MQISEIPRDQLELTCLIKSATVTQDFHHIESNNVLTHVEAGQKSSEYSGCNFKFIGSRRNKTLVCLISVNVAIVEKNPEYFDVEYLAGEKDRVQHHQPDSDYFKGRKVMCVPFNTRAFPEGHSRFMTDGVIEGPVHNMNAYMFTFGYKVKFNNGVSLNYWPDELFFI